MQRGGHEDPRIGFDRIRGPGLVRHRCRADRGVRSPTSSNSGAFVLQEVVVTAERRHTDLQQTPISATVLSGSDLANAGVTSIDQLQFATPGAVIDNFGQGNDFNIRGVGKAEHNTQTTVGVVTYRDGVATFPGYFQGEPYYDVASIEILRGPQGTFGGQNATGGAVMVTTNDPIIGGGFDGYVQAQAGNYTDFGLQGAVNLPISDTLAARFAFDSETRDSFYHVTGPNGGPYNGNPGNLRAGAARVSLLWKPDDALTVLLKTDYDYLDFGAYPASPYNSTSDLFNIGVNSPQEGAGQVRAGGVEGRLRAAGWHHAALGLRAIRKATPPTRPTWTGRMSATASSRTRSTKRCGPRNSTSSRPTGDS